MSSLFHPVSQQAAIAALAELPQRLAANTGHSYLYRGSEGKSLRAQANQNLRWYQLFHTLNRRTCR